MAEQAQEPQDQSMEEILHSIKRIIAEENDDAVAEETGEKEEAKTETPDDSSVNTDTATDGATGSEVLELTETVEEKTEEMAPEPEITDAPEEKDAELEMVEKEPPEAPAEEATKAPEPEPEPTAGDSEGDILDNIDSLLSEEAAESSAAALESLVQTSSTHTPAPPSAETVPAFRSGTTVEDLALEALRPMLREWLDGNLPPLVEKLVKKEIKKISPDT